MTRKDAIEAIKCNWPDSRYTILREALDMAISALRQQEQESEMVPKSDMEIILHEVANRSKPMWISVKDRLPEPDVEVLLIAHGWNNREIYVGKLKRIEAERSWLTRLETKASDWTIWGFSYLKEPVVTHWMPLPKPPKED